METRQITQVHIHFIVLNGVYDRCEDRNIVVVSDDKGKLKQFYYDNLLPHDNRFRDDTGIYRSFKEGPLYNYNPGYGPEEIFKDEWISMDELNNVKSRYCFI